MTAANADRAAAQAGADVKVMLTLRLAEALGCDDEPILDFDDLLDRVRQLTHVESGLRLLSNPDELVQLRRRAHDDLTRPDDGYPLGLVTSVKRAVDRLIAYGWRPTVDSDTP